MLPHQVGVSDIFSNDSGKHTCSTTLNQAGVSTCNIFSDYSGRRTCATMLYLTDVSDFFFLTIVI